MKSVTLRQTSQLLHNKFVVILGGSVQRSMYKDLVLLLQKDKYLTPAQLKSKGEVCFEQDCLVEGGTNGPMTNGTEYREVRQFRSDHHLVRFYFLTRIYSPYMQSILSDLRGGPKPDVILVNSCIWDISRYGSKWAPEYRENLNRFFEQIRSTVPAECLILWTLAMPLGHRIEGGFLVPEIAHKGPTLRYDVIDANFYSGTLAAAYNLDVLDLHFLFRLSLKNHAKDGIHWDALAHRRITSLFLRHMANAWGVVLEAETPWGGGGPLGGGYRPHSLDSGGHRGGGGVSLGFEGGGLGSRDYWRGSWKNGGRGSRGRHLEGGRTGYGAGAHTGIPRQNPEWKLNHVRQHWQNDNMPPMPDRNRFCCFPVDGFRMRAPQTAPHRYKAPPMQRGGPAHFYREQAWSNDNGRGPRYHNNFHRPPAPHHDVHQPHRFTGYPGHRNFNDGHFGGQPPFNPRTPWSYAPPGHWAEEPQNMTWRHHARHANARVHPYYTRNPQVTHTRM